MNPSATGTIAVHTELPITEKFASSLRTITDSKRVPPSIVDRLDEPSQVGARSAGRLRSTSANAATATTPSDPHRMRTAR